MFQIWVGLEISEVLSMGKREKFGPGDDWQRGLFLYGFAELRPWEVLTPGRQLSTRPSQKN